MKESEHFYLFDILKILTLLAIAVLHANEFVFYADIYPLGSSTPVWHFLSYYARVFTLGGQVLISLIYFLFGLSGKSRKSLALISVFASLGQIVLGIVFGAPEWDIYAYIAFSNLVIMLPFFYKQNPALVLISLFFLCVPTHLFQQIAPDNDVWIILTGMKSEFNSGSWPLLPWMFLAVLNYQLGLYTKERTILLGSMSKSEKITWVALLALSLPFMGHYYRVPIGPNYYHFVFNQEPWIYWSNMLPFLFLMRAALLKAVQERLKNNRIVRWISNLYWNRHLGLVYLTSIIYLGIGMRFSNIFRDYPLIFDIFFIGIMPISEMTGRLILKLIKRFK